MLLAMPYLAKAGYNVNAHGCRGMEEGLAILRHRHALGRVPHLVVLALGTDFTISRSQIRRALHYIGPDRKLGLVTPWELGGYAGSDAQNVRDAARAYKKRVVLLDWVRYSRGHGSWFQPDGCHLTFSGAALSPGCSDRRCRSHSRRRRRRRTSRAESPAITAARVQAARAGAGPLSAVSVPPMSGESQIGVTGLAVMGANLARNIASRDVPVAVHNRSPARTQEFMEQYAAEGQFTPAESLEEFVASLEKPRRIIVMVKAGAPVDGVIEELAPLLDDGDIVIDAGNSQFLDTRRRTEECRERGLRFIGTGRVRRRGGRAARAVDHARRRARRVRRDRGDLHHDRRAGRRHSVLRLHRPRRRRPLREDGPQRHRVRRHAADHRGVRPAASRRRDVGRRAGEGVRGVERGRPRLVPDRHHRQGARQGGRVDRASR